MVDVIKFKLNIPMYLWQNLVAMAAEDMRTENEFLQWLIHRASMDRGLIAVNSSSTNPDAVQHKGEEKDDQRN